MNKSSLLDIIKSKLSEKAHNFEKLISETRASSNDTKSSMGDKYETGREMLQQEINNLQVQLNEVLKQQDFLKTILSKQSDKAEKGAIVKTEKGLFFISVSLGEISLENQKIICISPESPLAKAMSGKQENDFFSLNNINQKIIEIQ
ncbi:GreA/GreB family elongation factor [Chryseobacterium turcicum]|uniref:GreA/GreB family elongation factor n=1 Tax=Chryseobacterium turcicum TaxID=2898076 RepID=A0A9Q3YWC0_9FLAO|nr:GreA/GreB family elongation factor [Chryseobacterium turcicum]MCD1118391.1 GreA/GreB family elongation factor [Chryseobacterium turcicum]